MTLNTNNCNYTGSVNNWAIYPNSGNSEVFNQIYGCCNLVKVDSFAPESGSLLVDCSQHIEGRPNNVVASHYRATYYRSGGAVTLTCLENASAWIHQQGWSYGATDGKINGTQQYINCSDAINMLTGSASTTVSSVALVTTVALLSMFSLV